jgi:hypothetical protein
MLTEDNFKALSDTRQNSSLNPAKPLFVGSIPTAAFNLFNKLGPIVIKHQILTVVGNVVATIRLSAI